MRTEYHEGPGALRPIRLVRQYVTAMTSKLWRLLLWAVFAYPGYEQVVAVGQRSLG